MKTRPPILRARRAFTLIELITVMAIIAILMGLLFPVIASIRDTARRNKASTVIKSIVTACKSYANDYGKYPAISNALVGGAGGDSNEGAYYSCGDQVDGKCKVNNSQLFDVLRAIARDTNADHKLNRRQQRYFEDEKAADAANPREGFADGKAFSDDIQGQLLDPWGKQYCVILDADGDGDLKLTEFFKDQTDVIRNSAVAFSMAKDNRIGGKGYEGRLQKERSNEAPNDIVSWR